MVFAFMTSCGGGNSIDDTVGAIETVATEGIEDAEVDVDGVGIGTDGQGVNVSTDGVDIDTDGQGTVVEIDALDLSLIHISEPTRPY